MDVIRGTVFSKNTYSQSNKLENMLKESQEEKSEANSDKDIVSICNDEQGYMCKRDHVESMSLSSVHEEKGDFLYYGDVIVLETTNGEYLSLSDDGKPQLVNFKPKSLKFCVEGNQDSYSSNVVVKYGDNISLRVLHSKYYLSTNQWKTKIEHGNTQIDEATKILLLHHKYLVSQHEKCVSSCGKWNLYPLPNQKQGEKMKIRLNNSVIVQQDKKTMIIDKKRGEICMKEICKEDYVWILRRYSNNTKKKSKNRGVPEISIWRTSFSKTKPKLFLRETWQKIIDENISSDLDKIHRDKFEKEKIEQQTLARAAIIIQTYYRKCTGRLCCRLLHEHSNPSRFQKDRKQYRVYKKQQQPPHVQPSRQSFFTLSNSKTSSICQDPFVNDSMDSYDDALKILQLYNPRVFGRIGSNKGLQNKKINHSKSLQHAMSHLDKKFTVSHLGIFQQPNTAANDCTSSSRTRKKNTSIRPSTANCRSYSIK